MPKDDVKRKLTAIFSADVVGYSRLMGEDEVATVETLTSHKETMRKMIRQETCFLQQPVESVQPCMAPPGAPLKDRGSWRKATHAFRRSRFASVSVMTLALAGSLIQPISNVGRERHCGAQNVMRFASRSMIGGGSRRPGPVRSVRTGTGSTSAIRRR